MSYFDQDTMDKTSFGNTASDSNVSDISGESGNFLHHDKFLHGGKGGYGIDYSGVQANGGVGSLYVNEYTMVFDVFIPVLDGWTALFNTNSQHKNDADLYVDSTGYLGIGALGYTNAPVVSEATWHRLGFVYDKDDNFVRYYVDGTKVFDDVNYGSLDGRFALWTDGHSGNDLLIQGEGVKGGNYSNDVYLSSFLFSDYSYSDAEMLALGGVSKDGIMGTPSVVPIPAALPLFLSAIGVLGFIGRRKKPA